MLHAYFYTICLGIVWMFNLRQGIGRYSGVSSPEYHFSMCLAGQGIRATYSDSISRQRTERQKNPQVMSRGYPGDWVRIRDFVRCTVLANKPSRSPLTHEGLRSAAAAQVPDLRSPVVPPSCPSSPPSQLSWFLKYL
jgi:hypothetical protein